MPRKKVKVTFQKARPMGNRHARPVTVEMRAPKGLSPLAQYIEENRESGLSLQELLEQFQEFDCEHKDEAVITAPEYVIVHCTICGRAEKKER